MSSWQTKLIAAYLLSGFTVWAGATETAPADMDVPALPAVEAAALATEPELMPEAEFAPVAAVGRTGQAADRLDLDATSIRGQF